MFPEQNVIKKSLRMNTVKPSVTYTASALTGAKADCHSIQSGPKLGHGCVDLLMPYLYGCCFCLQVV